MGHGIPLDLTRSPIGADGLPAGALHALMATALLHLPRGFVSGWASNRCRGSRKCIDEMVSGKQSLGCYEHARGRSDDLNHYLWVSGHHLSLGAVSPIKYHIHEGNGWATITLRLLNGCLTLHLLASWLAG